MTYVVNLKAVSPGHSILSEDAAAHAHIIIHIWHVGHSFRLLPAGRQLVQLDDVPTWRALLDYRNCLFLGNDSQPLLYIGAPFIVHPGSAST